MNKFFSIVSVVIIGLYFSGCAPTPPEPTKNSLYHTPTSQTLTKTDSTRTTSAVLVCGCPFPLVIDGYGGDTSYIHYSIPTAADTLSAHTITVTAKPYGLVAATYTSWIAIATPDPNVKFLRDTLRDTLVIN
jgi:hypothetical protein